MDITEFLLARIAEDEAAVRDEIAHDADHDATRWGSSRVRAECEAKRRILAVAAGMIQQGNWLTGERLLSLLALPYADHPDYDEAWRP